MGDAAVREDGSFLLGVSAVRPTAVCLREVWQTATLPAAVRLVAIRPGAVALGRGRVREGWPGRQLGESGSR